MVSDNDLAYQVRESVSAIHMQTPVESIMQTARRQRRARRTALSATAVGCCAAIAVISIALASADNPPAAPRDAQLEAFTLTSGPAGSTSLTLHKGAQYRLDPDALRRGLAAHGIPALVTVGTSCDTNPEPDGLDHVVTARRESNGEVFLTIDPAAIPAGAELSIGYFANHTTYSLIDQNAPKRCSA
jgi:hypothetical protein